MEVSKRRPGRPKGDGLQDGAVLGRQLRAVFFYNRARKNGKSYEEAVEEAASAIRYSKTEAKRLLALAHNGPIGWVLLKGPSEEEIACGEGHTEWGIGEIPRYQPMTGHKSRKRLSNKKINQNRA